MRELEQQNLELRTTVKRYEALLEKSPLGNQETSLESSHALPRHPAAVTNALLQKLHDREAFFDRFMDQNPFPTWIGDNRGLLLQANPALKSMLKITDEDVVGKYNIFDDPNIIRNNLVPLLRRVFEHGETIHFILKWNATLFVKPFATLNPPITIDTTIFPVFSSEGTLANVVVTWMDITDRVQAVKSLRESEEKYRLLFGLESDAIFLIKKDTGDILEVNDAAVQLYGYSREELIGMNVETLCDDLSGEELRAFWASLEIGKSAVLEVTVRAKDGKLYPNDVNIGRFAFHDAEFYLAMARDVSERKAAEAELERYRNRLEELVTERTRQLEQAQSELVQKERMAVLGQLTATVSHELRNPLGTVKNAIYLLSRIDPADTGREQMEKALGLADRNVRRCDGIINELLDYSRQQDLSPVATDISALVAEVLDEQNIPDRIKLTRNLKKGFIAPCDPERLRRAIINVLTNSIQALEEKSGRKGLLKVQVRQQKERSEIAVSDNGPGIDEAIREKIFEPMFSTKNFGVGLGMPIVKNIMEEHGGDIEIESTPGQGTTVTLWLPHVDA